MHEYNFLRGLNWGNLFQWSMLSKGIYLAISQNLKNSKKENCENEQKIENKLNLAKIKILNS